MKQLITIKHIIFVILILLIILSLFGENLHEGLSIKRKMKVKKNKSKDPCVGYKESKSCNKDIQCGWKNDKCGKHECGKQKRSLDCRNINQGCTWYFDNVDNSGWYCDKRKG